jgi:uncharacterized protein (UPF0147 family)
MELKLGERSVCKVSGEAFNKGKNRNFEKLAAQYQAKQGKLAEESFSMEQKAHLYTASVNHGVGVDGLKVEQFAENCLRIVNDSGRPATERADALLALSIIYNKSSSETKRSQESVAMINALSGGPNSPAEQIANGLFTVIEDPASSREEKDKAGELLAKLYNDPEIPKGTKDMMHMRIQTMAHDLCIAGNAFRFGFPEETVAKMMPPNEVSTFVIMEENVGGQIMPYSDQREAEYKANFTVDPEYGGDIFDYGVSRDTRQIPTVFLKSGHGIRDIDREMNSLMIGFSNKSFGEACQVMEKLLSLSGERNLGSIPERLEVLNALRFKTLGFLRYKRLALYSRVLGQKI